uniref:Uncharacterized protein n=1 Tax=Heterorhabditis bacteriophora TaxID=37862 RepID=A0A1I7WR74_HETBA
MQGLGSSTPRTILYYTKLLLSFHTSMNKLLSNRNIILSLLVLVDYGSMQILEIKALKHAYLFSFLRPQNAVRIFVFLGKLILHERFFKKQTQLVKKYAGMNHDALVTTYIVHNECHLNEESPYYSPSNTTFYFVKKFKVLINGTNKYIGHDDKGEYLRDLLGTFFR